MRLSNAALSSAAPAGASPAGAALFFFLFTVSISVAQDKPDALELYRQGRYDEAVEVCLQELQELPRNMDSYTVMGWSLIAATRYEDALAQSQAALALAPYDHRIIGIAGESLYFLGKNSEALRYFELYASIAPTGVRIANVYYYMGEVFVRLGQYNNADISFSTALHFDDKHAEWWSRMGYAREMRQDFQWSKEAYENALKLNPNLVEAQKGLESIKKKLDDE